MGYWLAQAEDRLAEDWLKRFDPRFWTVNFPRPAMGSVVTAGADGLRVACVFYRRQDRVELTWESADGWDHPLLAYETVRDYRGLTLSLRWRASGDIASLNAAQGPTLSIVGRDAAGFPFTWSARLWNYASGSGSDARIRLDFDALPVWAGDVDRVSISIVPDGYAAGGGVLPAPAEGQVTLSEIWCEGGGATIGLGDAFVPPHGLRMATDYDGLCHLTPARVLQTILHLGYRDWISHSVGASHYFQLVHDAGLQRFLVADTGTQRLNGPARAWHADFYARAQALGVRVISGLSFALADAHAPEGWKQRDHAGAPALSGQALAPALISPCSGAGMAYLQAVALEFCALAAGAGLPVDFQVREPGWWCGAGRPCFYDAATLAVYTAETGRAPPARHQLVTETPDAAQEQFLDWLGVKLGAAALSLRDTVKAAHPGATVALLFNVAQASEETPILVRANSPASWASPAFDIFQVQDFAHVTAENWGGHARGIAQAEARFGYLRGSQHYFGGCVVRGENRHQWRAVGRSLEDAWERQYAQVFVQALPQVMRDGLTFYEIAGEDEMGGFHDVRFPVEVGYGAGGGPEFSTTVIGTASGFEQRNINWAEARGRYDAGLGVRSEADLATVTAFFRARRGRAFAFRFRDPFDFTSAAPGAAVTALDQRLGTGDGTRTTFSLVKHYGETEPHTRRITRPVVGTVRVALNGVELPDGWSLGALGEVQFEDAPPAGAAVTAGFEFDVAVRFGDDQLSVSLAGFRAGEIPSIPLVEVREA